MKKSDIRLEETITYLNKVASKEKANIWKKIAEDLSRPTRKRRAVNIYKINKIARKNETVVVPGKVLATGDLNHKLTVAAYQFSEQARNKIIQKGVTLSLLELVKKNPKGKNMRIIA